MAYDFLKKLFKKDENGAIIPMTAEELEAAIDADKNIKVVDLRIRTLTESRKRFLSGNRSITPILRH